WKASRSAASCLPCNRASHAAASASAFCCDGEAFITSSPAFRPLGKEQGRLCNMFFDGAFADYKTLCNLVIFQTFKTMQQKDLAGTRRQFGHSLTDTVQKLSHCQGFVSSGGGIRQHRYHLFIMAVGRSAAIITIGVQGIVGGRPHEECLRVMHRLSG